MFPCKKVGLDFLSSAPARFDAQVEVHATPEQIFEVFEDAHAWTVWAPPITNVDWTSPKPYGVGTTRTVSMIGGLVGYEEFIAWERGKRMAFCFVGASRNNVSAFAEDYRVTALGAGKTRVEWTMAMEPAGVGKWTMPLFAPVMRFGLQWMLGRFGRYVEGRRSEARQAA